MTVKVAQGGGSGDSMGKVMNIVGMFSGKGKKKKKKNKKSQSQMDAMNRKAKRDEDNQFGS
jgi:hypothetical protein